MLEYLHVGVHHSPFQYVAWFKNFSSTYEQLQTKISFSVQGYIYAETVLAPFDFRFIRFFSSSCFAMPWYHGHTSS